MFPKDIAVWERFLEKYSHLYEGFYYDVKVGKPARIPKHWNNEYKRDAEVLSKLRIDVVGVQEGAYNIIEVKPHAKASAIGQVLAYQHHFEADYNPDKTVQPVIVAESFDQNMIPIMHANGIADIKA